MKKNMVSGKGISSLSSSGPRFCISTSLISSDQLVLLLQNLSFAAFALALCYLKKGARIINALTFASALGSTPSAPRF